MKGLGGFLLVVFMLIFVCVSGLLFDSVPWPSQTAYDEQLKKETEEKLKRDQEWDAIEQERAKALTGVIVTAGHIAILAAGFGVGGGALILGVGATWQLVQRWRTSSRLIYPGKDGQMPMVNIRKPGSETIYDPNRSLGPAAAIQFADPAASVRAMLTGQAQPAPQISTPVDAALVQAQAAVTSMHQAVQMVSAATRHGVTPSESRRVHNLAFSTAEQNMEPPIDVEPRVPRLFYETDSTGQTKLLTGSQAQAPAPNMPTAPGTTGTQVFGKSATVIG